MQGNYPKTKDLNTVSKKLKQRQYLYISSLVDIAGRFQESVLKVPLRFTALSLLIRKGGSLTPTELARRMFRSKHSITNIIDSLEKEGYVERHRDSEDRRIVNIKITTEGLNHVKERVDNENPIIGKLMSCLDEKETEQFLVYVNRLRKELINVMIKEQDKT